MSFYNTYWNTPDAVHSHGYYAPLLFSLLPQSSRSNGLPLKVLDIGSGNGSLTNLFAEKGFDVTGIEDSAMGVEQARQAFPNCQFLQYSVYSPPPSEFVEAFDVVISSDVIEHLFAPRDLVVFARQCLKPNGQFIITTPYHGYLKNLAMALTNRMDRHYTALWDGGHIKFFSVKTLSQLLQEAGFKNLQFKFAGGFPYLWKGMLVSADLED